MLEHLYNMKYNYRNIHVITHKTYREQFLYIRNHLRDTFLTILQV